MALKSAGDVVLRLQKMEQAVSAKAMKPRLIAVGEKLKPLAVKAANADLGGDNEFSRWKKIGGLQAQVRIHRNGMGMTMGRAKKSAGGWRVAEDGRGNTNAGGFSGPGVNRKSGATNRTKKGNLRKVSAFTGGSKWSGYTKGKGTWSDAASLMDAAAPALLNKAQTQAMRDAFLGK